jgi:ceramide glucosyltransferase
MTLGVPNDLLHWTGDLAAFGALLGIVHLALAAILILRFPSRQRSGPARQPPVTILVPLCGEDSGLYDRLAALCDQVYSGPRQLVCGLQNPDDPAIGIVKAVARDYPDCTIDLQIDAKQHGSNHKVSNLINMMRTARHDVLVIIDSDMLVGPTHLADAVGELQKTGVGAVTCIYHGLTGAGASSALSALGINSHFLPGVITTVTFGLAQPCFGATIALSRSVLETIGGLRTFADCLHDDYAIGAAVRNAGYQVAIPHFSIGHVCREHSIRDLLRNQIRYARTIRMIEPVGYAGSIITHPSALALIAMLLGNNHGFPLLVLALCARFVVCLCIEHCFTVPRQAYWLLPIRDLLSFGVFITSYVGAHVSWRGEHYRLNADGSLIEYYK